MFCDPAGSTSLAAKLDAEDWRNLVGAYLDEASAAVTRSGGHLLKRLGDGLMALFGYPHAHENDAERGVRAALTIQRALSELNARNTGKAPELATRIGVDSVPVVVDASGEVFGEAPNIAARVQTLARNRTEPCQGWGRGFESLRPLQVSLNEFREIKTALRGRFCLEGQVSPALQAESMHLGESQPPRRSGKMRRSWRLEARRASSNLPLQLIGGPDAGLAQAAATDRFQLRAFAMSGPCDWSSGLVLGHAVWIDRCPPKVEATCSNRVGRAISLSLETASVGGVLVAP